MKGARSKLTIPVQERRRPGRPGPQSIDKDQMRDRILDSSEQLFSESGYSSTSFRDIARLAQVNPALIGYYFGIFGLLPFIGLPLAIVAIVLGKKGLNQYNAKPTPGAKVHAMIALVLGIIEVTFFTLFVLFIVIAHQTKQ